jgi:hypothetical protein
VAAHCCLDFFERLLHHDDAAAIVIDPFFGSGSISS